MIVNCTLYEGGHRKEEKLSLKEAGAAAAEPGAFVWLGLVEPSAAELEGIASEFDLHELAVEDAVKAHQRPKLERYGDTLFVVVKTATYIDPREVIEVGELLIFANPAFLITVRHGEGELAPVRDRLDARPDLLEHGVGMVLYSILDHVVDGYEEAAAGVEVDIQAGSTGICRRRWASAPGRRRRR